LAKSLLSSSSLLLYYSIVTSAMTAIKKFEIHLEHDIDEQYQYEPGETLCGDVLLVNNEDIRVCSIQVQVRGEATVAWDDESTGGQFSAKEVYMDATVELPLTEDGSNKAAVSTAMKSLSNVITVSRGEHLYPLEIPLLKTLPSSFIGKYGSITYVLKATLREDKVTDELKVRPVNRQSTVVINIQSLATG